MKKEKEKVAENEEVKEKRSGKSKALTAVGIIICILLIPILVVNVTMIIQSYVNPDKYPSFAGYSLMIVLSPSMEDTIMTGDLIVVKEAVPEDIKGESSEGAQDGDIISFFDPSSERMVVTHRCKTVTEEDGEPVFITKGDDNISEDPTPCPFDNLIGTYVTRIPGAGNIAMWLQSPVGLIVCVAVPIVLLVAYDLIMKKRFDKKKKKDTDALLAELEALRAQQSAAEDKKEAKAEAADTEAKDAKDAKEAKAEKPAKKKEEPDDAESAGEKTDADEKSDSAEDKTEASDDKESEE